MASSDSGTEMPYSPDKMSISPDEMSTSPDKMSTSTDERSSSPEEMSSSPDPIVKKLMCTSPVKLPSSSEDGEDMDMSGPAAKRLKKQSLTG